jgi:phosphoribosylanthranilate isomerase
MAQFDKPRHADMMIKVCGMKRPDNIADVASLAPMLMGFIFHSASPRDASGLDPEIVKSLPGFVHPVAVTVNRTTSEILDITSRYGIKIVQLHGSESPEQCKALKEHGLTVFKAVGVGPTIDWAEYEPYVGIIDMFVFDTKSPSHGGTGRKFDWHLLDGYSLATPYLLSGGIGPDDIEAIKESMRPGMAGIDINSRFETSPGEKNIRALVNFIVSLRKYNEYEPNTIPFWEKTK